MKHVGTLSRKSVLLIRRSYDEITRNLAKTLNEDDYIQTNKTLLDKIKEKIILYITKLLYRNIKTIEN